MRGCQKTPTPSSEDPVCKEFFTKVSEAQTDLSRSRRNNSPLSFCPDQCDDFHEWPDVDEIEIYSASSSSSSPGGDLEARCFR